MRKMFAQGSTILETLTWDKVEAYLHPSQSESQPSLPAQPTVAEETQVKLIIWAKQPPATLGDIQDHGQD